MHKIFYDLKGGLKIMGVIFYAITGPMPTSVALTSLTVTPFFGGGGFKVGVVFEVRGVHRKKGYMKRKGGHSGMGVPRVMG